MRLALVLIAATLAPAAHAAGWTCTPLPPRQVLGIMSVLAARADDERDPAKLAARIGKNARAAGDLLAARDTGAGTRRTQSQILRDIDKLLDQANNPPPPQGGGNPPPPPDGGEPPPPQQGEGGQPPPPPGSQPGAGQPKSQPGQQGGQPKPTPGGKGGQPGAPKPEPQGQGQPQSAQPKPGKPAPGGAVGGGQPGPSRPRAAPPEDAVAKQVWGHLPERLRREMNQYYKEQFMPKYGDLLRDYYSGLAESRPATPRTP